jgi:hypothetical protein
MFRTQIGPDLASDLVVIPKAGALQIPAADFVSDYRSTLRRLNLSKQ